MTLRSSPFQERDRVITALTEHSGLVTAVARNSIQSRRFGGALDSFGISEWRFVRKQGAELVRLDQATIHVSFPLIRTDLDRLAVASTMNETILKTIPQDHAVREIFLLHSGAFQVLESLPPEDASRVYPALLNTYLMKILQWSGLQPQLTSCLACEKPLGAETPGVLSALVQDAGWICCESRGGLHEIRTEAIKDLLSNLSRSIRKFQSHPMIPGEWHIEIFRWIESLMRFHIPGLDQYPMKSLRFLPWNQSLSTIQRATSSSVSPIKSDSSDLSSLSS